MKILELPEAWRSRAIVIRDVVLSDEWFTPEELEDAQRFRLPKRREEWMRARIAAKHLAISIGMADDPRAVHVMRPAFSISHAGPYAAASIGGGIDVEVVREMSERAAHLFLTEEEIDVMQRCAVAHRAMHFWSAKEAAWKARSSEFQTLRQLPLRLIEERENGVTFDLVETIRIDDAIIALTS